MTGPGEALFSFVRHWARRATESERDAGRTVLVTEAVNALRERGAAPTINAVAREIGVDQSGASRMVRAAIDAGYLGPVAGSGDGRVRVVEVTASGTALLDDAHRWQERFFAELTEHWSETRRAAFQAAMSDLVARSADRVGFSGLERAPARDGSGSTPST